MNEAIAARIHEIQAAAKKQVMGALADEQTAKLEELIGEEFKRNPKNWQEHQQRTLTRSQ